MKNSQICYWELPDKSLSALKVSDMEEYGYKYENMYPINTETAKKIISICPVYKLFSDNTEALAEDVADIIQHDLWDGIFGVECDDWLEYRDPYYHSYWDCDVFTVYKDGKVINQIPHNGMDYDLYQNICDSYKDCKIEWEKYIARDDLYNSEHFACADKKEKIINKIANEFFDGDTTRTVFLTEEELQVYADKLSN